MALLSVGGEEKCSAVTTHSTRMHAASAGSALALAGRWLHLPMQPATIADSRAQLRRQTPRGVKTLAGCPTAGAQSLQSTPTDPVAPRQRLFPGSHSGGPCRESSPLTASPKATYRPHPPQGVILMEKSKCIFTLRRERTCTQRSVGDQHNRERKSRTRCKVAPPPSLYPIPTLFLGHPGPWFLGWGGGDASVSLCCRVHVLVFLPSPVLPSPFPTCSEHGGLHHPARNPGLWVQPRGGAKRHQTTRRRARPSGGLADLPLPRLQL